MPLTKLLKKKPTNGLTVPVDLPAGFRLDRQGELVLPEQAPGECVDLLYRTREARLAVQRQVDKLAAAENRLKDYFIETLPKSEASGLAGDVARVQIKLRQVPTVDDWDRLYKHVKQTGNFELLQRRLNTGAVQERWENKESVPGVTVFNDKTVSVTKL